MLEMETLSPLNMLKPGASVTHIEIWELFNDVPMPSKETEIHQIMEKVRPETSLHPCKP
jgi:hypothetical protein